MNNEVDFWQSTCFSLSFLYFKKYYNEKDVLLWSVSSTESLNNSQDNLEINIPTYKSYDYFRLQLVDTTSQSSSTTTVFYKNIILEKGQEYMFDYTTSDLYRYSRQITSSNTYDRFKLSIVHRSHISFSTGTVIIDDIPDDHRGKVRKIWGCKL